ncbi:MAG: DUF1292 domain-containing protein [Oscillospiraceae bacterium]|jgi:uncharacterized protein YrzB (UPF0473 family)|nr:DUF1292 domain-containing protein [Oscillospiraceae bacterium]
MEENFELFTLQDEDGNEAEFELLDVEEIDGAVYYALCPYKSDEELLNSDGEDELAILKLITENGEDILTTIVDDEEFERIGEIFLNKLQEIYENEDIEEEETIE